MENTTETEAVYTDALGCATDVPNGAADTETFDERDLARVIELFSAMPGNQKVFFDMLDACREPKTPAALDELMQDILATNRSVFRPVELRHAMEEHGALRYIPSPGEKAARARLLPDGSIDENEPVEVDDEGYLVFNVPEQGKWVTTACAQAYLDSDPLGVWASDLIAREERYVKVYEAMLSAIDAGTGERQALASIVDVMPECQTPRMWVGHFLGEAEHISAITWVDTWQITSRGKEFLSLLREKIANGAAEDPSVQASGKEN